MMIIFMSSIAAYLRFYSEFLQRQWHHMSPAKYGILLISIGVFGWFLMKSGMKKT
jgi:hypothetical protein